MAIYIPGIAGEIFGSIGNVTFSKVKSGFNILKKKPRPSLSLSIPRNTKKTVFSQLVHHWKTVLTNGDKQDWQDQADNFVQDRHGEAYDVTGFNVYCGFNALYFDAFSSIVNAPTIFAGRIGNETLLFDWNAGTHKMTIDVLVGLDADHILYVWWTDAQRPGATYQYTTFPNHENYNRADAFPLDLNAEYRAMDGTIFLRWLLIDVRGSYSFGARAYYNYTYV